MSKLPGQNPLQQIVGFFFNLLFWTWRFRARLEHPAPSWTVLDGPAGSSRPTWCAGAASGPCQRFSFTSHPQVFSSEAACGPPFADPAANPGEKKSDARYALVRVNLPGSGVPLRQQVMTSGGQAHLTESFQEKPQPPPPQEQMVFTDCPNCVWKIWPLGKKAQPGHLPSADRLLPREQEPWLLGYYCIIQALRNLEKPCPTLLWNRNWFRREQCFFLVSFRLTRTGLAEIKDTFHLSLLLLLWNNSAAVHKEKAIAYSVFIGLILKFQCILFYCFSHTICEVQVYNNKTENNRPT